MKTVTKITKITTEQTNSKKFVKVGNRLVKDEQNTGVITRAKAETIQINDLHDLKEIINKSSPNEMLILGHNIHADIFTIVPKKYEVHSSNTFGRTKDNFTFDEYAIILLDFDNLGSMSIHHALQKFADYYPSFKAVKKLICKSSTGSIKELNQNKYHVFVKVKSDVYTKAFKQWDKYIKDSTKSKEEYESKILLDPSLFSTQENRVVFLKPEVPTGYTIDKCFEIVGTEDFWNPSEELEEDVAFDYTDIKMTVKPKIQVEHLCDNNHSVLKKRFDKWVDFDFIRELAINAGFRPSKDVKKLFTPGQTGTEPKSEILKNQTNGNLYVSCIGRTLNGKKGFNAFPLLVLGYKELNHTDSEAYMMAICRVFELIGGNDVEENKQGYAVDLEALQQPSVVGDKLFSNYHGFDAAKKEINKNISTFVKSVHGAGKTQGIVKDTIVNMVKGSDKRLVYIAPTISLCEQAAFDIAAGDDAVSVASYSNFEQRKDKFLGNQIVITTPNSFIDKVIKEGFVPDIIVIDEWVRVAASLVKRDGDEPFMNFENRKAILNRLRIAPQVVLLDADESYYANELAKYIGVKSFMNNSYKEYKQPSYVVKDAGDWSRLIHEAFTNKNGFIFSDTRAGTETITEGLVKLGVSREKIIVINSATSKERHVISFLANPNKEVINYDYVIYSPSMNVGSSITSVEYPTIGVISGILSPFDVLQGLRRNRKIGVVDGVEKPISVYFQQTKYNKAMKSGKITDDSLTEYKKRLKKLSCKLFSEESETADVMFHFERYMDINEYIYNQIPKESFIELLEFRDETFEIESAEESKKVIVPEAQKVTKKEAKKLSDDRIAEEVSKASVNLPSELYHSQVARLNYEREYDCVIEITESFKYEKQRDAMELLLDVEEGWLNDIDNCKQAISERWLERALAFNTARHSHKDFFKVLVEIGNGSLKTGDFNKEVMTLIKEYCWKENGLFADTPWFERMELRKMICGNYLTAFGLEYGRRAGIGKKVGDNGYTIADIEKADGRVVAAFLKRLGIEVCVSRKRVDGIQIEYATIKPASFIRCKEMSVQEITDRQVKDFNALMSDFSSYFNGENI